MWKYLQKRPKNKERANENNSNPVPSSVIHEQVSSYLHQSQATQRNWVDLNSLELDPGLRKKNSDFHPNQQDEYDWLEYSIAKDAAFCLPCYLFKQEFEAGGDHFVGQGFGGWNKKDRLEVHVGNCDSPHNKVVKKCDTLMNQKYGIQAALSKQSEIVKSEYHIRLEASVIAIRYLLRQGLAFWGNDESDSSKNRGNFYELLKILQEVNPSLASFMLKNAPRNNQMTSLNVQKDIACACATEISNEIIKEIGDDVFGILIDESGDISGKEQMVVIVRYVDRKGFVMERFIGIAHVADTTAVSLKSTLETMLVKYKLCISRIRGQGYDGASNMRGEYGGLKTLIHIENNSAYYIHCFAHQLQLALVAVVRSHEDVDWLFFIVTGVVNVIGSSNKRRDMLRDKRALELEEAFDLGKIEHGRGLNQELALSRAGDTRWGSHLKSLSSLVKLFSPVIEVLDFLKKDSKSRQKGEARAFKDLLMSFECVFMLHLMRRVLGITNDLSQMLQKRDQDIANAMRLVQLAKQRLQTMRDEGWEDLIVEVSLFCHDKNIVIANMDDRYVKENKSQRLAPFLTNMHHYKFDCFYNILDLQLEELESRFDVIGTTLLSCVACLNPSELFSAFDKASLIRLTKFYPEDFSDVDVVILDNQLENYILDVRSDERFPELKGLGDLSRKLVETKKHTTYPLVYMLVKLALILPVATATVERAFSAMSFIKNKLRNSMCDEWVHNCLMSYIEKDVSDTISNETIIARFQNMKPRQVQL